MMDEEKLNNDLSRRITEVFDNYEDTTADEGWALLRQKYPPKEKDRGLAWLWYAAAAVVLLGLGVWFIQKPVKPDNLVVKQTKPAIQRQPLNKPPVIAVQDTIINQIIAPHNQTNNLAQNQVPQAASIQKNNTGTLNTANKQPVSSTTVSVQQQAAVMGNNVAGQTNVNVIQNPVAYQPVSTNPLATRINSGLPKQDTTAAKQVIANTGVSNSLAKTNQVLVNQPKTNKGTDSTYKAAGQFAHNVSPTPASVQKTAAEKAFNSLFEGKNEPVLKENKTIKSKKTIFSVYAATYFNYAKGSDNKMNVGAGFTSDFKLTEKLRLSTGLAVGQNSLSYNTTPAPSGNLSFAVAATAPTNSFNSSVLSAAYKTPILQQYNANLVGLDIPINLKYQFSAQTDTYVAAGVSSGTFINENYQSLYNNSANNNPTESTTHSSFSNFDLAKTLNFSFGIGYPLGKSNRLIVEPFLKYPLDGLGSQQLKFGAGGVNLKLNFKTLKK